MTSRFSIPRRICLFVLLFCLQINQAFADIIPGDFNDDGLVDASDFVLLDAAITLNSYDPWLDVTFDGRLDHEDRVHWVKNLFHSYIGDANLDGEFNSGDLIAVFQSGEYEDDLVGNSTWFTGDWNGDGEFDTSDFIAAFQDGGYEKGPM